MPASIKSSASTATAAPTARKRAADAKKAHSGVVKSLQTAMSQSAGVTGNSTLDYIIERLSGEDSDLSTPIADLLRDGGLRQAVLKASEAAKVNQFGKELAASQLHYRTLRDVQLYAILNKCEPATFTQEVLEQIPKDELLDLVCFALGVKRGHALPSLHQLLRYTNILASFCARRYERLGRRLSSYTVGGGWGYFRLGRKSGTVSLAVRVPGDDECPNATVEGARFLRS